MTTISPVTLRFPGTVEFGRSKLDTLADHLDGCRRVFLVTDVAIVDPELTFSMPPAVTAATGVDALVHCIEACTNRHAHPVVDVFALEGIRLIGAHLERAVWYGGDAEARIAAAFGSAATGSDEQDAREAIRRVRKLSDACGIPGSLAALNIPEQAIPGMASAAVEVTRLLDNNPRTLQERDAVEIFTMAHRGVLAL